MHISVFGLGYVGSVTAACLAKAGHDVIGVDVNTDKVAMVDAGMSPVIERGLSELIREMHTAGRLRATASVDSAIHASNVAMICVGTPSGASGQLDTSAIERVLEEIGHALSVKPKPFVVIMRSTVLPGTTETLSRKYLPKEVRIAMNPEFMREGSSISDFERPPMTVVGCDDETTAACVREIYRSVEASFVRTSIRTAEMVKYTSNAFHALKVCFANEIADLCEALGADAHEVSRTFLMDRKLNVSEAYLRPGFAFGGSCLPKDLRALMYVARRSDLDVPLLTSIRPSNEHRVQRAIQLVLNAGSKRVGVVGLAFKSGTDDLRESPMVAVVEALIGKGCAIRIFDPTVRVASLVGANRRYISEEIPHISSLMCEDLKGLVDACDVLIIGTQGPEAHRAIAYCIRGQVVIDLTRAAVSPMNSPSETAAAPASDYV